MSLRRSARLSIDKVSAIAKDVSQKATQKSPPRKKETSNGTENGKRRRGGAASSQQLDQADVTKDDTFAVPALPTTPKNKRRKAQNLATPPNPPPLTPTPSGVKLIADSSSEPSTPAAPLNRPAEPHVTNAPLHTPRGSRVVAYAEANGSQDSMGNARPAASTTTANLLEEACAYLIQVDPKLRPVIEKHHCKMFSPEGLAEEVDPFSALASGIMGQQVRIFFLPKTTSIPHRIVCCTNEH